MTAFYTCKSDLHTYILNSACKISVTMLLHRLIGSSVHTSPITRAMPVTVVKMNTGNIQYFCALFHSVSLNLSIESSYPAALTYQIPGFYLFQKYCFTSDRSSYFWNSSHFLLSCACQGSGLEFANFCYTHT